MTGSERHPEGWISVVVPPEKEERAKAIRAERDLRYGNIFQENRSDERWVGDLAELVFRSWLKHEGVSDFEWIVDESAGKPDFILRGAIRIDPACFPLRQGLGVLRAVPVYGGPPFRCTTNISNWPKRLLASCID